MKNLILNIAFCLCLTNAFCQLGPDRTIPCGEQNDDSYVIIKNGKFGITIQGKETISPIYNIEQLDLMIEMDGNAYFSDSAAFPLELNGKWGVMDNHGQILVPFEYDYIHIERSYPLDRMEYAGVDKNGKTAIMDSKGKLTTGFVYDAFYGYYQNDGMITQNPKLAMKMGDHVVFYDPITTVNLANSPLQEFGVESKIVYNKNKLGVISENGDIILPVEYDAIRNTGQTVFENRSTPLIVGKDGKFGIWQFGRGLILPMQYENATMGFVDGSPMFTACENKKWALLDVTGKKVTEFEYDNLKIGYGEIDGSIGNKDFTLTRDGKATLIKR